MAYNSHQEEKPFHINPGGAARQKGPLVVSITSGKGGVGKTLTTINMAICARQANMRVLIFDGDLGLSNVDVVLGLQSRYNIYNVLDGSASIQDVVIRGPLDIDIVSSGSGVSQLQNLTYIQREMISQELFSLEERYDLILIDTGAGISDGVIALNQAAQRQVVVTTPEPHAMTDAYALLKVLREKTHELNPSLMVNMTRTELEGETVAHRINDVAKRFIQTEIPYLGCVPLDQQISRSVLTRNIASQDTTTTLAGQAWGRIARSLLRDQRGGHSQPGGFWESLLWNDPLTPAEGRIG